LVQRFGVKSTIQNFDSADGNFRTVEHRALQIMSAVGPLPIELQDVTPQRSFRAAELKVKYKFYYIDSFAAALALEHKATLVTSDSDFRKLGHDFPVLWLRN
jgi:predicted nucleic acid-binding protein